MRRETAGQIDTGKQGKRIGKINRDGIEKREKRQRGKGKIEKGGTKQKEKRESAGRMTDEDKREGKHGRRRKKTGRRWQGKIKQNRRGKPPAKRGEGKTENCESVRRNENTQNDAGRFRGNVAEEEGKSGRRTDRC